MEDRVSQWRREGGRKGVNKDTLQESVREDKEGVISKRPRERK